MIKIAPVCSNQNNIWVARKSGDNHELSSNKVSRTCGYSLPNIADPFSSPLICYEGEAGIGADTPKISGFMTDIPEYQMPIYKKGQSIRFKVDILNISESLKYAYKVDPILPVSIRGDEVVIHTEKGSPGYYSLTAVAQGKNNSFDIKTFCFELVNAEDYILSSRKAGDILPVKWNPEPDALVYMIYKSENYFSKKGILIGEVPAGSSVYDYRLTSQDAGRIIYFTAKAYNHTGEVKKLAVTIVYVLPENK